MTEKDKKAGDGEPPVECASPPCLINEVDPAWFGLDAAATDARQPASPPAQTPDAGDKDKLEPQPPLAAQPGNAKPKA
jgi:hypothetical protein